MLHAPQALQLYASLHDVDQLQHHPVSHMPTLFGASALYAMHLVWLKMTGKRTSSAASFQSESIGQLHCVNDVSGKLDIATRIG